MCRPILTVSAAALFSLFVFFATTAQAETIEIRARDYVHGVNIEVGGPQGRWGPDVIHNAAPYHAGVPNQAEYNVMAATAAPYDFDIEIAAAEPRAVDIYVNGELIVKNALHKETTGSWMQSGAKWFHIAEVALHAGANSVVIKRGDVFPHFLALRFTPEIRPGRLLPLAKHDFYDADNIHYDASKDVVEFLMYDPILRNLIETFEPNADDGFFWSAVSCREYLFWDMGMGRSQSPWNARQKFSAGSVIEARRNILCSKKNSFPAASVGVP